MASPSYSRLEFINEVQVFDDSSCFDDESYKKNTYVLLRKHELNYFSLCSYKVTYTRANLLFANNNFISFVSVIALLLRKAV